MCAWHSKTTTKKARNRHADEGSHLDSTWMALIQACTDTQPGGIWAWSIVSRGSVEKPQFRSITERRNPHDHYRWYPHPLQQTVNCSHTSKNLQANYSLTMKLSLNCRSELDLGNCNNTTMPQWGKRKQAQLNVHNCSRTHLAHSSLNFFLHPLFSIYCLLLLLCVKT